MLPAMRAAAPTARGGNLQQYSVVRGEPMPERLLDYGKGEIIRKAKIINNCTRTTQDYQFSKGTHEIINTSIGLSEQCTIQHI